MEEARRIRCALAQVRGVGHLGQALRLPARRVVGAIRKLEKYKGCIIADSVGLGKTFEALAVIKYYQERNDRVLVLCPKRLRENWTLWTNDNDDRNPLAEDRFNSRSSTTLTSRATTA